MNNLNLPQVASNQNQKEVTINDQAFALDAAITEALTVDLSGGGATLTEQQFTRNVLFILEGADQPETVVLPQVKRLFAVDNRSQYPALLEVASSSVSIPAETSGIFYSDGATLTSMGSGGGGGGIPEAPIDGNSYARKDGDWEAIPPAVGSKTVGMFISAGGRTNAQSATKGNRMEMFLDIEVDEVIVFTSDQASSGHRIRALIAELNGSTISDIAFLSDEIEISSPGAQHVPFSAPGILLEDGKQYFVACVRTDGAGDSVCEVETAQPSSTWPAYILGTAGHMESISPEVDDTVTWFGSSWFNIGLLYRPV